MNKILLALGGSVLSLAATAQVVEVQSIAQVPVQGLEVNIARLNPAGTAVVASSNADNALYSVDLATGAVTRVADNGSALELAFSTDGSAIVYKTSTTKDRLRYYRVTTTDLTAGSTRHLTGESRHCASFSVSDQGVLSLSDQGRLQARSFAGKKLSVAAQPVVSINRGHLEVTMPDGTTTSIDPQGRGSYLWPTLSPDGTKIAYYAVGFGCYVCNLDGSDPKPLGYIHAPRWLNNDVVIGCKDYDDGTFITSASIVAADLKGNVQTLTPDTIIALNPSATADGRAIAFSTPAGELYVITLK